MMTSGNHNPDGDGGGNENYGKAAPPLAPACYVGLGLNMQYAESTHPAKNLNFMSNPSQYPPYGASIEFDGGGGGRRLFDNSMATTNQVTSATSFKYTTGGEIIFTASQMREFENQTLIYKHIMSSIPIPSQLLLPLSTQSNRSDLEPWRCKRTDGKKWRCSRDVMPDQKYCERHAHKNRPRSRKHVETRTKNPDNRDNYHSTLPQTPTMPPSCEQSRWFMKTGTTPISSSMNLPNVGSKRDHFLQNLEGSHHQDLVEVDNCSLTLMQPGGNDTCDDQDLFQMGIGMLEEEGSNPCDQWVHHGSWLGGPLGEALCPGVAGSFNRSPNVTSREP